METPVLLDHFSVGSGLSLKMEGCTLEVIWFLQAWGMAALDPRPSLRLSSLPMLQKLLLEKVENPLLEKAVEHEPLPPLWLLQHSSPHQQVLPQLEARGIPHHARIGGVA